MQNPNMHTSTTQFVAHPSLLSSSWCGRCDPSAGCEFASHWAGPWWMGVWGAALCWVSGCGSLLDSSLWMTGTSLTWTHVHTRLSKNEKKNNLSLFLCYWHCCSEVSANTNCNYVIHTHHFFDLSLGAGLRGMRKRALIGCMSQSAKGSK